MAVVTSLWQDKISASIVEPYVVAPMTTSERAFPFRVGLSFHGKMGQVALDQLRSVDRTRLVKLLGTVPTKTAVAVSAVLVEMFQRS